KHCTPLTSNRIQTRFGVSIGIWTSAGIAATGQVIFNEETAKSGYYLKITYQEDGEINFYLIFICFFLSH
ncbi:MAG: hypothetical protein LUF89_01820, partial [Ruminococcus sp.]|nr:hypothetical protein [Ruminococcus sp.]